MQATAELDLRGRLEVTNRKIDDLNRILLKKSLLRSGGLQQIQHESLTSSGLPIYEYRAPQRSIKAVPKAHALTSDEIPPFAIREGSKLDILRRHNLEKTLTKIGMQEQKRAETLKANPVRKPRSLPKLSVPASLFPTRYARGELPCTIEHGTKGQFLSWACPLENLDYEFYLPIFFDGIRCKQKPCTFLARQGIEDLLYAAKGHPERVRPCIKLLTRPLKHALSLFDTDILLAVLKSLQQILEVDDSLGTETNSIFSA